MYLFSAGEHWHPTSVVDYLRDADLKQADGHVVHPASIVAEADADRQKACRTAVGGCVITINCPSPDQDCARALSRTSVIYARVINNPLEAEHATARDRVQRGLTRLVQYWAFYRYDDWRGWWGGFRQWHEGDWELVTIGLGANGPLFVAFSAHCGGIWRPWSKVGGLSGRRTAGGRLVRVFGDNSHAHHVMAFIAEGSHGSYPDDGLRAPDWASCTDKVPKLFYVATFGPTLGGGVREHLDQVNAPSSEVFGPPVAIVDGRTSFMQFNGHWGDSNHFDLFGDDTVSAAPPTPLLQSSWREPLHTIFCNRFWRPKGSCPKFFDHD